MIGRRPWPVCPHLTQGLRHDRAVANNESDGTHRRFRISAWLPPGLALGWLAALSAFVHGGGRVLADWAVTSAIGLLIALTVRVLWRGARSFSQRRSKAQTSPKSLTTTEPARPVGGAEQAATSTAHDAAPAPPTRPSARPMAQDSSLSPAPKMTTPGGGVPAAAPAAGELAVALGIHVLTTAEVASVLRVEARDIATAINNGELPGNRIGGDWRVDLGALRRWLQGRYPAPDAISGPPAQTVSGDEQN